MTKVAYLDCPTGISGDMCLGALVHAGVPLAYLTEQLGHLGIANEFCLRVEQVHRNGQQATKVYVDLLEGRFQAGSQTELQSSAAADSHAHASSAHSHANHSHHRDHSHPAHSSAPAHETPSGVSTTDAGASVMGGRSSNPSISHSHSRFLPEIEALILAAHLTERATRWSLAIFRRLAEAEGAVHGISPEQVHFHEVGATDAIVDIVGTCIGLDWLGIEQLYCSALPVGGGTVWAAHGRLPVPPPAVLKLWELRQVPLYSNGIDKELVTPTGAAIVTTLATHFGPPPPLLLQKVGLGAGTKDLPIPNILRLWIGEAQSGLENSGAKTQPQPQGITALAFNNAFAATSNRSASSSVSALEQEITVLETQIDDLNPQAIGYVMTELLSAGALDVFTQAIGMKKSRPGVLLTVICHPEQVAVCEAIVFRETTTLGIRRSQQQRIALERTIETVTTAYGSVGIKIARWQGAVINAQPEYEDCARLAQQHHLPWREMHRLALQSWYSTHNSANQS